MSPDSPRRIVSSWLVVVAASVLALKAADRVPTLLSGTPPGVRVYPSVRDAERGLGVRLWLPAYYPDSLAWPPARVDSWAGPPRAVALRINGRATSRERLVVVESFGVPASIPAQLLAPGEVLTTAEVVVGRVPATVVRLVIPSGEVVHDVRWVHGDRRIVMRYHGPVEELLLIAESLEHHAS